MPKAKSVSALTLSSQPLSARVNESSRKMASMSPVSEATAVVITVYSWIRRDAEGSAPVPAPAPAPLGGRLLSGATDMFSSNGSQRGRHGGRVVATRRRASIPRFKNSSKVLAGPERRFVAGSALRFVYRKRHFRRSG